MRKWLLSASACAFALFCAHAAEAANLNDVYQAARQNDPVLGAAKQNYDANREVVPQARSQLLPYASTGAYTSWNERQFPGATYVDSDPNSPTFGQTLNVPDDKFNEHAWQAQLSQPVFDAAAYFNYRGAKSQRERAGYDYVGSELTLIVRVVSAYLDILRAQALVDSTQAEEQAVKRQLEQVQQRFDVGLVAVTDVLEARAAYDGAFVRRIQAEGDQSIFFETLSKLTGSRYNEIDRLGENLPIRDPEPADQEEWVNTALANNPDVKSAREVVNSSRENLLAQQAGHLPVVDGSIVYTDFDTGGLSFIGGKTRTTIYKLSATLPIYQGGYVQSRVREARSRVLQSEDLLRDREWSVKRDTYNLLRAVSTDVVRVNARIRAIRSAESALEATQTGYEVGTRNIVDVLQAQQRLYLSQYDYADSRYNYVNDLLFLKRTAGTLNDADVDRLNTFADAQKPVVRIDKLSAYAPDSNQSESAPAAPAPPPEGN